jgi:hypothetical protein
MWAVIYEGKEACRLHGRPKTKFVWLRVTKLALAGPLLECHCRDIPKTPEFSFIVLFVFSEDVDGSKGGGFELALPR